MMTLIGGKELSPDAINLHQLITQVNTKKSNLDQVMALINDNNNKSASDQPKPPLFTNNNPYIHGTNSNILELLIHTDFYLMEPIDMIDKYGIAPITGEITGGGFDSVWCQSSMFRLRDTVPKPEEPLVLLVVL